MESRYVVPMHHVYIDFNTVGCIVIWLQVIFVYLTFYYYNISITICQLHWAIPFNIRTPPVEDPWNFSGVKGFELGILQG
jgi:hypothetical protein